MPDNLWLNADGTTSPIVKATADAALPDEGPSQEFLQALVGAEQDRLRAEGWEACVAHIRRKFDGRLSPEDIYWVGRQNAFRTTVFPPEVGAP